MIFKILTENSLEKQNVALKLLFYETICFRSLISLTLAVKIIWRLYDFKHLDDK